MIWRNVLLTFLCALVVVLGVAAVLLFGDLQDSRTEVAAVGAKLQSAQKSLVDAEGRVADVRVELDEQLAVIDGMADQQVEAEARLRAQIDALDAQIRALKPTASPGADVPDSTPQPGNAPVASFDGVQLDIRLRLPDGLAALEMGHIIYIANRSATLSGMIREFADEDGAPISPDSVTIDYVLEQTMNQLGFEEDARPEVRVIALGGGEGRRFSAQYDSDDGETYCEICVLCARDALYLFELEAPTAQSSEAVAAMDDLLSGMTLSP